MRRIGGFVLALLLAFAPGQGALGETARYKASFFDVFDTYSEIIVYAQSETEAQTILDKAHAELLTCHQLFDIYNLYDGMNNLKTVNDNAGVAPVKVDQRLIDLIAYAKQMEVETNGRMNIAMGSVLSIWHTYREAGINDPAVAALPPMADLQAAAEHTDIHNIIVDTAASTLYLSDPAMSLDVGAIAKGFSVERVAQELIAGGVTSALLSIGGNVRSIGMRGDGTSWRVNVQNPDLNAAEQSLTTLDLKDLSLVTSGSYQRYYTVNGKQYHHIIDPDTLMPAEFVWAVSVVTQDSGLADALSTALFNLSIEDGKTLLQNYPNTEALWVTLDGQIVRSDGFSALAGEEIPAA
ncbi:MAG TPA: FAD:protein FMN transferase [Candidatus Limiplasma sp.]|nr:FAD:protein FMN transferase [Candidatus Limiplasma sp.]HPS80690.1 FAD:protein FMN transferase [Candidatus Limiplasma sp.]